MIVEVVALPKLLKARQLAGRVVVVFDVLRATTSMLAALAAGASQIKTFDSLDAVLDAYRSHAEVASEPALTCGELSCVKPADFDFGNSPGSFSQQACEGRTLLMSTTNGTRAIYASRAADQLFIAAIANASATATRLLTLGKDVTLLCSGTEGEVSIEDTLGAGAVIAAMTSSDPTRVELTTAAVEASQLFRDNRGKLRDVMYETIGGRNIRRNHLDADIDFAAQLDRYDFTASVSRATPPVVTRA